MYQLKTENDYDFSEVISALQKEIRRGHEEAAMFWGLELYEKYWKALWTRLQVICNEDIGIANPQAIILIQTLKTQFEDFVKGRRDGSMRLVLANAILYLCRSPKSREADHFQCVINQRRLQQNWRLEIPDYCLDKHTARGARMKRSWAHWFSEGCQLIPEPPANAYQQEAQSLWLTSTKQKEKGTTRPKDESSLFAQGDE
jgi:replication-associated recombination protein RarA